MTACRLNRNTLTPVGTGFGASRSRYSRGPGRKLFAPSVGPPALGMNGGYGGGYAPDRFNGGGTFPIPTAEDRGESVEKRALTDCVYSM